MSGWCQVTTLFYSCLSKCLGLLIAVLILKSSIRTNSHLAALLACDSPLILKNSYSQWLGVKQTKVYHCLQRLGELISFGNCWGCTSKLCCFSLCYGITVCTQSLLETSCLNSRLMRRSYHPGCIWMPQHLRMHCLLPFAMLQYPSFIEKKMMMWSFKPKTLWNAWSPVGGAVTDQLFHLLQTDIVAYKANPSLFKTLSIAFVPALCLCLHTLFLSSSVWPNPVFWL